MSDQRIPRTHSENVFWVIAAIIAIVFVLALMQNAVGLW
ncbi:hypothetical protein SAMN06265222_101831 [Neorhodopirellula lusitana]|uniref:Uncharacterized protein n=1 Tax=Neorhodopirellula lusitana TaxID=445327 RepID=A0ABY1PQL1_9BACT|nr:hypothetical protein SAMN06265222_101831 [Neorhodopirellula lusitana]